MRDPGKALGVSDLEISPRQEHPSQSVDEPFLRRAVKINHHIPAKDDLKLGIEGIGILKQIHEVPLHIGAQFRLHPQSTELGAHSSLKVAPFDIQGHFIQSGFGVDSRLSGGECRAADIRAFH